MAILIKIFFLCGWVVCSILHNQLYAQEKTGILKEKLHESTYDSPNEFQPQYKYKYGYDYLQRLIYEVQKVWDNEKQVWKVDYELFQEYDQWGNESGFKSIHYKHFPDTISSISERKYSYIDTLIMGASHYIIQYNFQNQKKTYKDENMVEYTYLGNGGKIRKRSRKTGYIEVPEETIEINTSYYNASDKLIIYCRDFDNSIYQRYDSSIYYYNNSDCELGSISFTRLGKNGLLQSNDSSLYIYNKKGACKPDTIKRFQRDSNSPILKFSLKNMTVNIMDINGLTKEIYHYEVQFDSIYILQNNLRYEYDEYNREILKHRIYTNYSYEYVRDYDSQNNLIYLRERIRDSTSIDWKNIYEIIYEFDDNNRRIYQLSEFDWNHNIQQYQSYYEEHIVFNHNDLMIQFEQNTNNWYPEFSEKSSRIIMYEDRCDGNYKSAHEIYQKTSTEGNFTSSMHYENRITFSYYDIAFCENLVTNNIEMILFPNPTTRDLHIRFTEILEDPELKLINNIGQVLLAKSLPDGNFFSLDLDGLNSGIYTIQIIREGKEYSKRFILSN